MWNKICKRLYHCSELTNGIRVASVNSPAEFDAAGIVIKYGHLPAALRHLALPFDKAIFKGNEGLMEADLLQRLDGIIGSSHGRVAREHLTLGGAVSPLNLPDLLALLRDLLVHPPRRIEGKEVAQAVEYELLEWRTKHIYDKLLPELAVAAAFPGLGTSVMDWYLKREQTTEDSFDLSEFWREALAPSNLTLIGLSGNTTRHTELVGLGNSFFVDWPLSAGTNGDGDRPEFKATEDMEQIVSIEDSEMPLSHLCIAYPGLPAGDPNAVALKVLERLLGGGGSFSAGGPGKGMYARLYTTVLNRYYWLESAKCFSRSYTHAGVFGIHGSAPPEYIRDLAKILQGALHDAVTRRITTEELERAKAQVKSNAFMDAEGRLGQLDEVADQLVHTGRYVMPEEFGTAVDAVSAEQLTSLAARLVTDRRPAMAVYGTVDRVPSLL